MHCVHLEAIEAERQRTRKNALFYLGDTQTSSSPDDKDGEADYSDLTDSEGDTDDEEGSFSSDSEGSISAATSPAYSWGNTDIAIIETLHSSSTSASPSSSRLSPSHGVSHASSLSNSYTDVVTLAVPVMKQRSSSLDAGYVSTKHESPRKASLDERSLHKQHKQQQRAHSLDATTAQAKDREAPTSGGGGSSGVGGGGPTRCRDSLTWLANLHLTFK
jgi:hypothetical protein